MTDPADPRSLLARTVQFLREHRPFAIVSLVSSRGSTPAKAGAKMLVEADHTIHGTIGGGAVEAEAQRYAADAIRTGSPRLFESDLGGPGTHTPDPICGGWVRLLIDPSPGSSAREYTRASEHLNSRKRGVWLTTLRAAVPLEVVTKFVAEDDLNKEADPALAQQLRACLDDESARLVVTPGEEQVFIEPLVPRPLVLIIGGGHVAQAVALQGSSLGFDIAVVEDRPMFADPKLFPAGTRTFCGNVETILTGFPVDSGTYIVIVTRGHQHDSAALRACIGRPAAYVGMIGSRRKVPLVRQQFLEAGWATPDQFDCVYAPIGLDIGAKTVPEIATSIMAQIVSVRRTGRAGRMPVNPVKS